MSLTDTAAVAKLGVGNSGITADAALSRSYFETEGGAFFDTDTATVAKLRIDNGLFPLLSGDKLALLAVRVKNALIFADIGTGTAFYAAVRVDLMLFLHLTADSHDRADLSTVVTALASVTDFIRHIIYLPFRNQPRFLIPSLLSVASVGTPFSDQPRIE